MADTQQVYKLLATYNIKNNAYSAIECLITSQIYQLCLMLGKTSCSNLEPMCINLFILLHTSFHCLGFSKFK